MYSVARVFYWGYNIENLTAQCSIGDVIWKIDENCCGLDEQVAKTPTAVK